MIKMNKRGVFMALYLVLLTLFMCGLAVFLFLYQNGKIQNSMVSPLPVLNISDQKAVLDSWENRTLTALALEFKTNGWGDAVSFKQKFCDRFNSDFALFKDFFRVEANPNLCASIYQFNFNGDLLEGSRSPSSNSQKLVAQDTKSPNFQVNFEYSFSGKYLINKNSIR